MTLPRCTVPPTGAAAEAAARQRALVPVLETPRLRLRAPTLDDLAVWTGIFLVSFDDDGQGPERAWEEFSSYTAGWLLHGHGLWAVERKDDGACIGFVLIGLEWDDEEPELGYLFTPAARGQGYATEAAAAARDWGLGLLPTFVSYVDTGNRPSNRLAKQIGARRDRATEAGILARQGETVNVWRHGAMQEGRP